MRRFLAALLLVCLLPLAACGGGERELVADDTYSCFNTRLRWVHSPRASQEEIRDSIFALAEEVEESLSAEGEGPIARFNAAAAGEKVELDAISYRTLTLAKEIYEETEGAYNPALGLLTDLWGFSPRVLEGGSARPYDRADPTKELPDETYIEGFLPLTDFSAVTLSSEGERYFAQKPNAAAEIGGVVYTMQLDLGGVGKGMCADILAEYIESRYSAEEFGAPEGYLALAESSLLLFADPRGQGFEVALSHPRASGHFLIFSAQNTAISTSGDAEQYYEIDGKRYCHIIDGSTGRPTESGIASATVLTDSAARGDALSTALVVMGPARARQFLTEHGLKAALFSADGTVYTNLSVYELLDPSLKAEAI